MNPYLLYVGPITLESVSAAVGEIQTKYGDVPSKLKLSQKTFNDLYDYAFKDMETDMNGNKIVIDKTKDRPFDPMATIFGVRIELDETMDYGKWKFER